ncbi:MAG: capsule assembly Wzi family protein [Spirosomataceae bacterium]
MPYRYFIIFFFFLIAKGIQAQVKPSLKTLQYDLEVGSSFSSSQPTPFWLRTNQYGITPFQNPFFTLRASLVRNYLENTDSTTHKRKKIDWGFGTDGVLNLTPSSDKRIEILWPELYGKIRWGVVELYGGKRRELVGLGDSTLSSGFMAWSGNALPFPKIQLQTIQFVPLKFIKSLLAFKVSYAHGWFNAPYIQGAYLHQKTVYMRFGKPHWPLQLYAGLNHQVQWGGHADYLINSSAAVNGQLPASFRDYLSLVTGRYPDDYTNDRYNSFDGANRIGNHLGSYDFALEWRDTKKAILLYHQHPYEDASGLAFQNFPDGLTGIRLQRFPQDISKNIRLKRLVIEYLNTTDQSGEDYNISSQYQGGDSYFNHGQYAEGWSYFKNTIGTPFIAPYFTLKEGVNSLSNPIFFPNNRLIMGYVGSEWVLSKDFALLTRSSFSRNWGAFGHPFVSPVYQFSFLLSTQFKIPQCAGILVKGSLSFDQGQLLPNTIGGYIGLKKTW